MRLWHYKMIPLLDNKHLSGQHRECCALRGKGWGKKHATVDYAFKHSPAMLFEYHWQVMCEMLKRGYSIDERWLDSSYRGKEIGYDEGFIKPKVFDFNAHYHEHDDRYLEECIDNLKRKGYDISIYEELL